VSAEVEIRGLAKRYGQTVALDDVSVNIPSGRVLSVLGPSGCGKSTLLRIVAGLAQADAGTVRIGDLTIVDGRRSLAPEHRPLNLVFQDYALWPHMRVSDNIGYGLHRQPKARRQARVEEMLDLFRIEPLADRFPSQLSGGQQQRVAIARAIATNPEVLLFDEPLSNLDVQLRADMRAELGELLERVGTTAIYVTHDPIEACVLADTVIVLRQGAIVQHGTPEELFTNPANAWVASLAGFSTQLPAVAGAADAHGLTSTTNGSSATQWLRVGEQDVRAVPVAGDLSAGSAATIMIHPDDISLTDGDATHDGAGVRGTVRRCSFEGRAWRVSMSIAGASHLSVVTPRPAEVGSEVTIAITPGRALAFGTGPT